jgi:hypothetical protein
MSPGRDRIERIASSVNVIGSSEPSMNAP